LVMPTEAQVVLLVFMSLTAYKASVPLVSTT
jgi:hypothetical protein